MAGEAWITRRRGVEGGERGSPGLAQEDGAGAAEGADDGGVCHALATRVERRAELGGEPAGLEYVLDAEGDTVEEAVGEGVLRRNFDPGLDVRFAGGNAAQADFQQVARRLPAGVQGLQEFQEHYKDQPSPMSRTRCDSCREAASGGSVRSAPEGLLIAYS